MIIFVGWVELEQTQFVGLKQHYGIIILRYWNIDGDGKSQRLEVKHIKNIRSESI